jgi:hypothetical protein
MESYQNTLVVLQRAGIQNDGEGHASTPAKAMETTKAQNGALVEKA